ncbi:hydrolase [Rhodocyclus gracilis]|uniref:Hydrolase n=1 Tax=Rhodocyclus tenuis TaxID=1066 RepID=A0A6L5JUQ7_RHOTE|nr:hydrolase [Rhodocyclus gracilis]MQY50562.1 hydrolase [Rhodocyclus gracilis]
MLATGAPAAGVAPHALAYRAPAWLPGAHTQTIYPLFIVPPPLAASLRRRERWATPDDDFIDVDWFDAAGDARLAAADSGAAPSPVGAMAYTLPAADAAALPPLVVLFHGLEGSADSPYARTLMRALTALGWSGVVPHFRGCSGEPNQQPRAYHSGDSDEIEWILERIAARFLGRRCYAAGVSLGGNALLKWAGERGEGASARVAAIAAISAPLDLAACGHHLARGFNQVYTRYFLDTLKAAAAEKLHRFPGAIPGRIDAQQLAAARSLYEFDDLYTAPVHGFASADDYWQRASAKPWLPAIRVPTLLVNAQNDPFMPANVLPLASQVGPSTICCFPRTGGHAGFVSGAFPGHLDWLPRRLLSFFRYGT